MSAQSQAEFFTEHPEEVDPNSHAGQLLITVAAREMLSYPPSIRLAIAMSVLLAGTHEQPDMMRRLLNESVVREGFRGEPMIKVLQRAAR
jgi:hypothetical protein